MKHDTTQSAVERFARVQPRTGHVRRVCARSGPGMGGETLGESTSAGPPWRWVLPTAATVMVVAGAVWQWDRASRPADIEVPRPAAVWSGKGVAVPVLPPRAYWEMSPFDEFERLRPGRLRPADALSLASHTAPVAAALLASAPAERPWEPLPPIEIEDITPTPLDVPPLPALQPIEIVPIEIVPIDIVSVDQEQQ